MKSLLVTASMLAVLAITPQAFAADLAARTAPVYSKAPEYAAVNNWTGWYIGGNVGYGWGPENSNTALPFRPGTTPNTFFGGNDLATKAKGVIGGAQFGYNWQAGSFLAGFEADIQGSGINGEAGSDSPIGGNGNPAINLSVSAKQSLSWYGTVRGRIGVTVIPDLLLYGTGGLAYGEVKNSAGLVDHDSGVTESVSVNSTRTGWAAGAGAEWKFARNWSAKFEYLHIDLGSESITGAEIPSFANIAAGTWHNKFDTVRAGVNYHFN